MAAAQDQCRTIRALTNADGRRFADLSFRVGRDPYRLDIVAGGSAALPAPRECSYGGYPDMVELACTWVPEGYDANVQLYDSLLARFRQCLGGRLTPPSGPEPYGNASALRNSTTAFPTAGGETRLSLYLIEAPATPELASYHYIQLTMLYEPGEPDED
jgi:hypothetical protein